MKTLKMTLLIGVLVCLMAGVAMAANYNEISGTNRPDIIGGTNKADLIRGYDGNDVIDGFKADDNILGGRGIDRIDGGGGTDYCYGGQETKVQRRKGLEDSFVNCESVVKD